ncbi:MAG: SiaC family regulatory phosphoprotein [Flavobacteriales bacterium]
MPSLIIEPTKTTPAVNFDTELKTFQVKGNSTPIDALAFYNRLADWLVENKGELAPDSEFRFSLPYFNSASNKGIYLLLKQIVELDQSPSQFKMYWTAPKDDEFMIEAAETMQELLDCELILVDE